MRDQLCHVAVAPRNEGRRHPTRSSFERKSTHATHPHAVYKASASPPPVQIQRSRAALWTYPPPSHQVSARGLRHLNRRRASRHSPVFLHGAPPEASTATCSTLPVTCASCPAIRLKRAVPCAPCLSTAEVSYLCAGDQEDVGI